MNPLHRLGAGVLLVSVLSSCSATSPKEATGNLNAACEKVRQVGVEIEALNLDERGQDAMSDPRVNELLKAGSDAAKDLAEKVDDAASANQGRLGQLRRTVDKNRDLIGKIGSFVASESIDEARDNARKFRKLADIIGADACVNS